MKKLLCIGLVVLAATAYGQKNEQSDEEKAHDMGRQAVYKMDNGKFAEAIKLLEECKKLDPDNMDYPYEIALAHYKNRQYETSIKVLKNVIKKYDESGRVWQLLGNSYDMAGNRKKAIATYDKGIKKFPNTGILYLERGNMEMLKENYNAALNYYEKGIEVEPTFPSNYFWASKIYMASNQRHYGLIYGEIFMNLESGTARTEEISKHLYNVYQDCITIESDTSATTDFCENIIYLDDLKNPEDFKFPYCITYGATMTAALGTVMGEDVTSLGMIRSNFVEIYEEKEHQKEYPNVLFAHQKKIIDAGHFEAYNYWLFSEGDPTAFNDFTAVNEEKWDAFVTWFNDNQIDISATNYFHTSHY